MQTINPVKSLDCLTALEVFNQVPIHTTGEDWAKHGILRGEFYLQANPNDERFDKRFSMTIQPWTPYFFSLEDGSKDFRITLKDFQPYPGDLGGIAGSLLISGKRPSGLNIIFDNHLKEKKAWLYLVQDYIPGLIDAGYNHIPNQNHTIAEISADKDNRDKYGNVWGEMDKEKILSIKQDVIELKTDNLFGYPLITTDEYNAISNLVN